MFCAMNYGANGNCGECGLNERQLNREKDEKGDQMNQIAERLKRVPPIKQYRIGEIAEYTGLSRQTVHNYTVMGLIRENNRTSGGHRLYDESVFETLLMIEQLRSSRTLREIRNYLDLQREDGAAAMAESADPSVS